MAKADKLFNVSPGLLILPDGTEVPPGGDFELTKDLAANAGVKSWLADGLVAGNAPTRGDAGDSAEVAALKDTVAALTARVAEADGQIAKLTADLEAATKPADK